MDVRLFALDIAAICALAFALYYPRHRRKDLAVALVGVNVGVLAVTTALSTATVGAGLGLGLFGVLSIIRLRSTELSQVEVAYYFAALAIGLIGGLGSAASFSRSAPSIPAASCPAPGTWRWWSTALSATPTSSPGSSRRARAWPCAK